MNEKKPRNQADKRADENLSQPFSFQRALMKEQIFRRAIEESVPCGIAAIDMSGHMIYANRHFNRMTGWTGDELLGTAFPYPYWPPDSAVDLDDLLDEQFPTNGIELRFRRKNGSRFWGLLSCAGVTDTEGKEIGRMLSIVDVTVCKRSEDALRALSSKSISAQEKERRRMSQELHDSIGGKLTAIKYGLEKVVSELPDHPESGRETGRDVLKVVHATIEEAQRISKNLHPAIIDDLGLLPAIKAFLRQFQEIYSKIRVLPEWDVREGDVPDDLKILIYRVTQEALNNVAKHSGATEVRVSLRDMKDSIRLRIQDDGAGFDPASQVGDPSRGEGMGIDGMRERTELFGGRFELTATPGRGVTVQATWLHKLAMPEE